MSIDGIGRGGGPPKVGSKPPAAASRGGSKFEVPESVEAAPTEGAKGAELLGQVQRGEVSLDSYLDMRVNQAVQHLEKSLNSEQLQFIKGELRQQLRDDPMLAELVRRATGKVAGGANE